MVTKREGEIVLDANRYKLVNPRQWQRQEVTAFAKKIGGGDTKYSDLDLWNVKAWTSWHLGRGEEYFETDGRYYDSYNCELRIKGQLTLGPHKYPTGVGPSLYYESGNPVQPPTKFGSTYYAYAESFVAPTGGFAADYAQFRLLRVGSPTGDVTVSLCSDSSGSPGTVLKSATVTSTTIPTDNLAWITFDWSGTQALTAAATYWLVVSTTSLSAVNYYRVTADTDAGYSGVCKRTTSSGWSSWETYTYIDLWFRLYGAEGQLSDVPIRFALFNDSATWPAVVKLFCLAGSKVYVWDATNNHWDDDSATLPAAGTDMVVWNDCLVVACGSGATRRKGATHPTAAWAWANFEPTGPVRKLGVGIIPTGTYAGKWGLIGSSPDSRFTANRVQCVEPGGTTWKNFKGESAQVYVGDSCSDVTWIGEYQGSIWIAKEDGVWEVGKDGTPYCKFPFYSQGYTHNFAGSCVWHNNELMLPAVFGLWSFDGRTLKNIGPGVSLVAPGYAAGLSGEHIGLPTDRQGFIKDLLPTINALYGAMDAQNWLSRYSSILLWNGQGWHEVIRGDSINQVIRALGYTPSGTIESEARLWYGYGKNVFYLILPDTTDDPYQWTGAQFEPQGWVEFGWFNAGLFDVDKDWREITVEAENVAAGQTVEIFYKQDDDTSFTSAGLIDDGTAGTAIANNQATLTLPTSTYGKRIKIKVQLTTDTFGETPKVTNIKLKYWQVPHPIYGWPLVLKLTDTDMDFSWRNQQDNFWTTYEKKEPVTMIDPYDNSWTVRLGRPVEKVIASDVGLPLGCVITTWAYEA